MQPRARQDRAERTRAAILAGAVDCLVRYGFSGTTMERIQQQSGVSRGALTHHFGSMTELLVAAVESIAEQYGADLERAIEQDQNADPLDVVIASLHGMLHRPVYLAGLELWAAARTDPVLQAALSTSARGPSGRLRELIGRAFDPPLSRAELSLAYDGLMSLLRGLALGSVVRDRPDRELAVLRAWLDRFQQP